MLLMTGMSSSSFHQQEVRDDYPMGWYPLASMCHSQPLVVPVLSIVIAWTGYLPAFPTAGLHSSALLSDFLLKLSQRTLVPSSWEYSFRKSPRNSSAKDQPNFCVINIHLQRDKWMGKILFLLKSVKKAHSFTSPVGEEIDSQFSITNDVNAPAPWIALVPRAWWGACCRDNGSIDPGTSVWSQCCWAPALSGGGAAAKWPWASLCPPSPLSPVAS